MKKLLLGLILMTAVFAASAQVEKYKSFQTKSYNPETESSPAEWKDAVILIVKNLEKKKIHIYAKNETDVDILETVKTWNDDEGNSWVKYSGIDESGIKCEIQWEVFKDQTGRHTATMFLEYKNLKCIYRMQAN